jgi:hypothetical protein
MEHYYVPTTKINAKIADIVETGFNIVIDNYNYERLSRKPKGRTIKRRLFNTTTQERIVIYG